MKGKEILFIVAIFTIAFIIGVSAASYAYFNYTDTGISKVVTTGNLSTTYTTGQNISATNLIPTTETNAEIHTFTIENTGTINIIYNVQFSEITLTKDSSATTSDNLKWTLYEATVSGDTYTVSGSSIATGTFGTTSNYTADDTTLSMISDLTLASGESKSYVLKIWLNETGSSQNDDQDLSFSAKVQVNSQQN